MKATRLTQWIIIIGGLVGFEIVARQKILDPLTFIPLSTMVEQLIYNLSDRWFLVHHLGSTALGVFLTFVGSVVGIALGVILWRSDLLYRATQPYLLLLYSVPLFALYPVFVGIFGLGLVSIVPVGLLIATPAIIVNTAVGLRETRHVWVKVGRSFNLSFGQMVRHIYFPAAWPHIFTGLRLGGAYAIIGVIGTEFILSGQGVGYSIAFAYNNFDLRNMYASILLVLIFSLVIITVLRYFESRLYR